MFATNVRSVYDVVMTPTQTAHPVKSRPAHTEDAVRTIPVRRVSFTEPFGDIPKHFARDENIVVSHVAAALSGIFPPGEDYFVRSVRHYRDQLTDPELKRAVAGFIGQEAVHGREHREANEALDKMGYNTAKVSTKIDKLLNRATKKADPAINLAVTAALEHFTAVLGEVLLTTDLPDVIENEGIRSLLLWHALEECEHKAVAFDVFRDQVDNERMRIRVMKTIRFTFIMRSTYFTVMGLLRDRATYRRGRLWRDLRTGLKTPLFDRRVWKSLGEYNREGFHPNDIDTDTLVERYREELFGPQGSLTQYLPASQQPAAIGA